MTKWPLLHICIFKWCPFHRAAVECGDYRCNVVREMRRKRRW